MDVLRSSIGIIVLLVAGLPGVWAQSPPADSVSWFQQPKEEERRRMYEELRQEVAALERQENILKKVVRLVKPTVVHIDTVKYGEPSSTGRTPSRPFDEAGSGVIVEINDRFYILTNRHVIKNAELDDIKIKLHDGRVLSPSRVLTDPETDIAVLAVDTTDLIGAVLGDSDQVEIGDFVLAVGSPFGLSHSITYGIISAKGRRDLLLGTDGVRYQDFLQTDAAINPGNSGGPLINLRGEVIGINTAIASNSGGNEGIAFTIPINMFMRVATQLAENGRVNRAFLGVHLDSQFTYVESERLGLPRPVGAHVTAITPGSPAETAGFRKDDVILEFDGVRIADDNQLINLVSLAPIGRKIETLVFRNGQTIRLETEVKNRAGFESRD